ncbi:hypothetical protein PoB_001574300 [Plakobranchus ocellatus]|uniref:Uncharacterized protein n=1 Tax=Plakobranchus ocellatus TaxID=259542 RepID=A0AAV3Z3B3_9GAST|nr:hypothetical protein PoB_001574300 [Plakobranchus ocellatus]
MSSTRNVTRVPRLVQTSGEPKSHNNLNEDEVRAPIVIQTFSSTVLESETEKKTASQSLLVMHPDSKMKFRDITEQPECATII